jgi:hypothetical protein
MGIEEGGEKRSNHVRISLHSYRRLSTSRSLVLPLAHSFL